MKSKFFFPRVFVIFFLLLASCSDDEGEFPLEGTVLSMDDIAGNWAATMAKFSATAIGPAVAINVIDSGGSVTLNIQTNGRFTLTTTLPGTVNQVDTGQLGFDEDLLVVIYDEDPDDYELFGIQLVNDMLFVTGPAEFDLNGDGLDEAARVEFEFERTS